MSEWTIDTLREHFTSLRAADQVALATALSAQEKAVAAALAAQEKAVTKAEVATEKRLEGMNEFRQTLTDQATTFMPRNESNARMEALSKELSAVTARLDKSEGSTDGKQQGFLSIGSIVGIAFGACGAFAALWAVFHSG